MNTYFLKFKIVPTNSHEYYNRIEGGNALCWIKTYDSCSAYAIAEFYILKSNCTIIELQISPTITKEDDYPAGREMGLEQYKLAQQKGIAIQFSLFSKDKKTKLGPVELKDNNSFDISNFIQEQKKINGKGRCLHYNGNNRCNEIIKSHSIQRNQSLSAIAQNGHVYTIFPNIGSLKKNNGSLSLEKRGINKVSTFQGFCKKHDNELFEDIDNFPLFPSKYQVALYAYRSICKEFFEKENTLDLFKTQLVNLANGNASIREYMQTIIVRTEFGLKNIERQKKYFDDMFINKDFSNLKYIIFMFEEKPFLAFSGALYPEFDFLGRMCQDLQDHTRTLDLITSCSAPMETGQCVLFAWHESSNETCFYFINSIAHMMKQNYKLEDMLFRFIISSFENVAISPEWWDNLHCQQRFQVEERINSMAPPFGVTPSTYLMEGLDGIATWKIRSIIDRTT